MKARKEVVWFSQEMERKLKNNDHKGGWKELGPEWLLKRLKEEVCELEDAINTAYQNTHPYAFHKNQSLAL